MVNLTITVIFSHEHENRHVCGISIIFTFVIVTSNSINQLALEFRGEQTHTNIAFSPQNYFTSIILSFN